MNTNEASDDEVHSLPLVEMKPYLTITILECVADDVGGAFQELAKFLRAAADDRGRALRCRTLGLADIGLADRVAGVGVLEEFGIHAVHGITRKIDRLPSWATKESELVDTIHQFSLIVRRSRLVAVCGDMVSDVRIGSWVDAHPELFRLIPADVLAGTFDGDQRSLWTRGVHPPSVHKQDSKSMSGPRLQEALNPLEEGGYAVTAVAVDYVPSVPEALIRDRITLAPARSRLSWRPMPDFPTFLAAAGEVLATLDKALADAPPPSPFGLFAEPESDLSKVRFPVDISLFPEEQLPEDATEGEIRCAELLRSAALEIDGAPGSATARLNVTARAGTASVELTPVVKDDGFQFSVAHVQPPPRWPELAKLAELVNTGNLITVYFGSGHSFDGRKLMRRNQVGAPFPNFEFTDFSGFAIRREKPMAKSTRQLHDRIGTGGDDSLFSWVCLRYSRGLLLCDDGPGEVADFLHLSDSGQLTAIHVKAAQSASANRRISVGCFQELVSQATKNVRKLERNELAELLGTRSPGAAAWRDGRRVTSAEFIRALRQRVDFPSTRVVLVQPHLHEAAHRRGRQDMAAGKWTANSCSLRLLDDLLHSTRRAVVGQCEDLTVIASR
ncbi:hypothetical protein AB0L88_09405 [Saccharopolyspora shandongensis]|uniref:hypothetical protein n=1 Tax=Saccharopolyspora shandongensis TaxID=418495 RepID=UPI00344782B2